ncbi:hypothetical protein [Paenarthrobacter sp. NPDC057981]|uniref:hypothetical protein n=1 Tax=Paenarthrobacter sp. NPDC057981 TaxID=3346297 RepID=UPI0036D8DF6A
MTSITATPDTATGSVQLNITQNSSVTKVTRSDSNGLADVRISAGQFPSPSAGTTILTDYEAAHGSNLYTVYCNEYVTATQQVTNPSFEVDFSGWTLDGTTAATTTSFPQMLKSGTRIAQIVSDGTRTVPGISVIGSTVRPQIVEGQWIGLKAFMATEQSNYQTRVQVIFRDAAGASIAGSSFASPFTASPFYAGDWPQVVAQAPAGAVSVALYLQYRNGDDTANFVPAGKRMWADAVEAFVADTSDEVLARLSEPYWDGATADTSNTDYAWTGTAHASRSTRTINVTTVSTTANLTLAKPWLMVPIAPNFSETAESITDYSSGRASNSTVHRIIGRADPIVVQGKLGTRTGTLEIWTDSVASANKLARVFDRGETVMLKQPVSGLDMYFAADDMEVSPYSVEGVDATRYKFTVRFTEVKRPTGNLSGALGWNFDALAAAYGSFSAVLAAYPTFDDLTIGGV